MIEWYWLVPAVVFSALLTEMLILAAVSPRGLRKLMIEWTPANIRRKSDDYMIVKLKEKIKELENNL